MRSVLLPVQEGFASVLLARRRSSRIPRAAMALPGLCRVCVCVPATKATQLCSPLLPVRPRLREGWGTGGRQ